jgi:hypothetical protein
VIRSRTVAKTEPVVHLPAEQTNGHPCSQQSANQPSSRACLPTHRLPPLGPEKEMPATMVARLSSIN